MYEEFFIRRYDQQTESIIDIVMTWERQRRQARSPRAYSNWGEGQLISAEGVMGIAIKEECARTYLAFKCDKHPSLIELPFADAISMVL